MADIFLGDACGLVKPTNLFTKDPRIVAELTHATTVQRFLTRPNQFHLPVRVLPSLYTDQIDRFTKELGVVGPARSRRARVGMRPNSIQRQALWVTELGSWRLLQGFWCHLSVRVNLDEQLRA